MKKGQVWTSSSWLVLFILSVLLHATGTFSLEDEIVGSQMKTLSSAGAVLPAAGGRRRHRALQIGQEDLVCDNPLLKYADSSTSGEPSGYYQDIKLLPRPVEQKNESAICPFYNGKLSCCSAETYAAMEKEVSHEILLTNLLVALFDRPAMSAKQ